jgi:pimeloyl-ACP methyl ester carboxylesterase
MRTETPCCGQSLTEPPLPMESETRAELGTRGEPARWLQPAPDRSGRPGLLAAAVALSAAFCLASGCCSTPRRALKTEELISPERLDRGYVLLLPGIMGCTSTDHELTVGLAAADVPLAIEMYDWTEGPWLLISNLRGLKRNRREAGKIAEKIVAYQERYPGRPVYIVGYSGGAGMAVMSLEALPPGQKVTGVILLAATLAPDYDLRLAMSHTEKGICNYYSPIDVPILMATMTLVGTMEGRHTVAAGAWGFTVPKQLDAQEREQYQRGLVQRKYSIEMLASGNPGGHFGWVRPGFVQHWVAPLVSPSSIADTATASRLRNRPH